MNPDNIFISRQMTEKHVIKISVELKVVKLLVRFPCKLTFQLKTDNSQSESRNSYDLKKGECVVNQTLETEAEINYDPINGQYEDKKVRLIIQMASTNGVIPAGSVSFNPCNKQYLERVEYSLPLEKCPDRSAQITFHQSFQLLRKNSPEIVYQSQFNDRASKGGRMLDLKYSTTSNMVLQSQVQRKSPRDISSNSKNMRLTPNNVRQNSPRNRVKTTVSHVQGYPSFKQSMHGPDMPQQQFYNELESSQVVQEEGQGYGKYSSKYMEPNEKAQYIKEIAKLKGQLKSLQSQDRWDQLIRVKEENESLGMQLQKSRDRLRALQRKERENNLQLKQAREESDRYKAKYLQSESIKNECEVILADRERTTKDLQSQVKRLEEKIQDLNVQLSNQQKRVQFKQNSYQEQLRKMNEKYTQSENERQKITFDYNTLLAKLEEAEKKNQTNSKEKERAYTEEKNRLNKKIDQLTQSLEKLKEESSDRENQLTESLNQIKFSAKRDSERQEKLNSIESELELNKMLLKKEQDQRKLYEKQIQQYKIIEEERNNLRKKNNQLSAQISKLQEKTERLSNDLNSAEARIRDLENTLNEKNRQKDSLNNKFNSTRKQLENLRKEEDKRQREAETLSAQNFNAGQKINDLKSKLQTEKRDTEELKAFYQEQLTYLAKGKEYCEHEIEQFKWSLQKSRQQYDEANNRLRSANLQILQLNEQNLLSTERAKRAEDQNKELNSTQQTLRREIVEWEQKERIHNEQLKSKGENIYDLQKKNQSFESEIFILREKIRQVETSFEQRRTNDEKNMKEREKSLGQKSEELTQLQLELMTLKEEIGSLSQESSIKNNEINYLKDSIQSAKQDVTSRDIKLEETREELNVNLQRIETLTRDFENTSKNLEDERRSALKLRKQWQDYRRDTTKALEQLIDQISKDQEGSSLAKHNLLAFPDSTISVMQVEAIKKRNAILIKYHSKISQLQEEKAILEGEVRKVKKSTSQREEDLEKTLKAEKDKSKLQIAELDRSKDELEKKVENLEQRVLKLSGEIQKSINEIKKRQDLIEQLNDEVKVTTEERELLRSELKTAEEKILALKSNEIKWKASSDSKISELSGQSESMIERYKTNITQLEKKLAAEEKSTKDKDQSIKKLEGKLNELKYERDRSETRTLEVHQKWVLAGDEKKDLEKKVKTLEKQIKEFNLQLQNLKESIANQKIKLEEVQVKLSEAHTNLTETQVEKEKMRAELESSRELIIDLKAGLKDKGDKMKSTGEKSSVEIKQLKEKIISLNSTIELKEFQINQNVAQIAAFQSNYNEIKEQFNKKKGQAIKLADKLQQYKNQELYTTQNIQILKSEKQYLEEENDRLKDRVTSLEQQMGELQLDIETADLKEKELLKLRDELQNVKLEKDRMANEIRNTISNPRASSIITSRMGSNGEEKRKIRELEQILESKHYDPSIERKKSSNEYDKQKRQLFNQNNNLKEQIGNLQSEFDFQRAQLNKEIQSLSEECENLNHLLNERNDLIAAQERLIEALKSNDNAEQIQQYVNNVKNIFERLEAEPRQEIDEERHQMEYGQAEQHQ